MSLANKPPRETPAKRNVIVTPSGRPRQFEMGGRSVTFVPLEIRPSAQNQIDRAASRHKFSENHVVS